MASGTDRVRGRRTGRRIALATVFEADFGAHTMQAILERHLAEETRDENTVALRGSLSTGSDGTATASMRRSADERPNTR